jgi:Flp pilus assembly CpaE family ATPase
MIFEVAPKSKAAEALTKLSHQIAGAAKDAKKPAGKAKSLFSFLRRA